MGNGVSYNSGVSPGAKAYYDNVLRIAGDKFAPHVMASLTHYEIKARLGTERCRLHARDSLQIVRSVVINQRIAECLDYLIDRLPNDASCIDNQEFRQLSTGYINWS
jgi:hypothetical protein